MTWFWICVVGYIGIGVGVWKLSNLITNKSWETVHWLAVFTVFYSSIFWVLTNERKFCKWTEYIQRQLEWE